MMCPISTPICKFLPLDNLRELTVMGVEMNPEGWVELFAEMEPIEELVLYKDECASVIPVLNPGPKKDAREIATSAESNVPSDPDVASPNASPTTPPLNIGQEIAEENHIVTLPNLHRLEVKDVDFNLNAPSPNVFVALMDCLKNRKVHNNKLPLLELRGCQNLLRQDVDSYKSEGIADAVDWDDDEQLTDRERPT